MIPEEILDKLGQALANVVARVSFMLWEKKEFREMIDFDKISQTEQDRIFNELEVSFLGLFYLYLDNLSTQLENQAEKALVEQLKPALKKGFISLYEDLKIEKKFIDIWKELINMRFEEYKKDFKLLMKEGKKEKEIRKACKVIKNDEKFGLFWARNQAITLACLQHIRRGKLDHKDPLRKYLQDWVVNVDKIYSDAIKELIFKPVAKS